MISLSWLLALLQLYCVPAPCIVPCGLARSVHIYARQSVDQIKTCNSSAASSVSFRCNLQHCSNSSSCCNLTVVVVGIIIVINYLRTCDKKTSLL